MEPVLLNDKLSALLSLPEETKERRGLLHTPREILQQPTTWETTLRIFAERRDDIAQFLRAAGIGDQGGLRPTVYLVGAGTSDYIGRALTHLLRKQWQCEVAAVPSTDLLTNLDEWVLPGRPYLWVSFSRSGESPEGVALLEQTVSRHPEIRHLVVCCNRNGRMVRQFAECPQVTSIVLNEAVNDKGLAMTGSFSNMVITGHCLAHVDTLAAYGEVFDRLVRAGKDFLSRAADVAARLAEGAYTKVCFIGTGALNAAAREAALKVLELTAGRLYTMSESALGVRHGPLSAVDADTLVVVFLSSEARRRAYELDLLAEIHHKGLGRTRVVITPGDSADARRLADHVISIAEAAGLPDEYRPPVDVILGQLLGLFASLRCGLRPDTPSPNGAISRVVGQVNIYL